MTAAWMMYLLLVGVLMTGAARVLAGAMRTFGRPTRWVWATVHLPYRRAGAFRLDGRQRARQLGGVRPALGG